MPGLIPVQNKDGRPAIMGRDLHKLLEVATPYRKWFPRMVEYGFEEGKDFVQEKLIRQDKLGRRREAIDHMITLGMAVAVSQYQRTEIGNWAAKSLLGEDAGGKPTPKRIRSKWVYFIATMDDTMVKIGVSQDVQARLAQLQPSSPQELHIVAAVPGGVKLERELHRKFARDHSHYEWFRFSTDIKAYIQGDLFQEEA